MISTAVLEKLKPCDDRWQNYLKFYDGKSFTHRQFMGLKNISHDDKVWVAFRLMPKENITLAAADIAESVLHIYEKEYPNDKRPRRAIEAARRGDKNAVNYAANAARAASDAAYANAAYAARFAAAYAAYAANAAANVAYAVYAVYTVYTYAAAPAAPALATSAAYCADNAVSDTNKLKQEKLTRTTILKYWKA